jgi:N-acetyl-anhydromuramyl-L-alanine amidase AmpD
MNGCKASCAAAKELKKRETEIELLYTRLEKIPGLTGDQKTQLHGQLSAHFCLTRQMKIFRAVELKAAE